MSRSARLLPSDEDDAPALLDRLAGKPDQPLDERAPGAAALERLGRRLEDDDVAAVGVLEAVDETVREHAVGEARLAARLGPRAVERGLHRGRRDAVRVYDPG